MLKNWSETGLEDGAAAYFTGQLSTQGIIEGVVLPASAMPEVISEREEQINSLIGVFNSENAERVAAELKRTILTVRVPKEVQKALDKALEIVPKPVILRLSPVGGVAEPLAPSMVIGISDEKLALDAVRMLYAELFSVDNLSALDEKDRLAAIIIQSMPALDNTYRIIRSQNHTVVEATRGLGAWVGFGEPDRFLFENGAFVRAENGDSKGVAWEDKAPAEFTRKPLGGEDAERLLAWAKPYLDAAPVTSPLLFCSSGEAFQCLGTITPVGNR